MTKELKKVIGNYGKLVNREYEGIETIPPSKGKDVKEKPKDI
tara:strand:+ start:3204 stop:3329 length:126 start_codon:yes stop_codon:yes gene_type:complete